MMKDTITEDQVAFVELPDVISGIPEPEADAKKYLRKKPNFEECKILSYNAYTGNLAFIYKGSNVQITVQEGMKFKDTVNVKYVDGKYNIVD